MSLSNRDLESWLPAMGWPRFGIAKLETPLSLEFYDEWLKRGYHGDMEYMTGQRNAKAAPHQWYPFAKSAIVLTIDYVTEPKPFPLRLALYTGYAEQHADYHVKIKEDLKPVMDELQRRYPDEEFRIKVDAVPILERDLARRAGLGWVGKNTCLIDRKAGSLFFIAEILTSLEINMTAHEAVMEVPDHCGTCTRCLDVCPTGALVEPKVLDATKCISYWTIEAKSVPPLELRKGIGDWFYGCDLCQTACPWNIKIHGRERMALAPATSNESERSALVDELRIILTTTNSQLEKRFRATPLRRARGFGLKRNAMIVAANRGLTELKEEVAALASHERLGELANWTLAELANR